MTRVIEGWEAAGRGPGEAEGEIALTTIVPGLAPVRVVKVPLSDTGSLKFQYIKYSGIQFSLHSPKIINFV